MSRFQRIVLCGGFLTSALAAQAALERVNQTERPSLLRPLATLPLVLGDWAGTDQPADPDIVERAQTTEYLNRSYQNLKRPGLKVQLWVNYSRQGTNLRHTPTICLPSGGWTNIESQTRELAIPVAGAPPVLITRLGYARSELVLHVGFWYYIFGEGKLENYVRRLPITSRSSHGRATRGSSITIEVFAPGDQDPDGEVLRTFAQKLITALEPILPTPRAAYHVP
jgi:EpsI family protein